MLERANFKQPASESVLIQGETTRSQPALRLGRQQRRADAEQAEGRHEPPQPARRPGQGRGVSRDGHSVLVQFDVKGDPDKAKDEIKPIMDAVAGMQTAFPSLRIEEVGAASATYVLMKEFNKDFASAERMTIPITLLILLAAFGSLVAACLPVVLAFSAVLASLGLYALFTHGYSGDYQSTSSVILLIGMAVGVDYSLFYIRREREERQAGREPRPALLRAASTSGQAVLISGADGARRDGRDADRGQQDLHLDRVRHDAGRPLRDRRLADRAPGGDGQARRPDRQRSRPVHRAQEAGRGRLPLLGVRARSRPATPRDLGGARRRASCSSRPRRS